MRLLPEKLENPALTYYVITGGPGVGKTTLLNELSSRGFKTVPEDARRIIKEQIQVGGDGLPWENKALYAQLMFDASLATYKRVAREMTSHIVFFDRGILDAICYMDMENIPVSEELNKRTKGNPYAQKVFILPPWEEIYELDNERKQTWEEAVYTFDKMKHTYLHYGYEVVEVPKDTIENRGRFISDIANAVCL